MNGDNGEPEGSEFYYSGQTLLLDIEGAVAKLRTIDGERCLLLYVGNELYDIYHEFIKAYKMETLYDLEAYLMLKTQLAGEYIDSKGDLVTFNADNRSVTGLFDDTKHFKVVEVYDMPSTILQFDETAYSFSHEDDGLLLTKMKCDTEDPESWEATEKTIRLYHVLPSQMKGTAGKSSRFDFASQSLLYKESLYGFTKSELKLMRNEIYARHGYQFSTPDMKEYFSKCPWYKPRGNNNAVVAAGLASFIIGTLGRVLIWLYAHKEYGTKIMWCIIVTVSPVIATFLQMLRYQEQYVWWLITDVIAVAQYAIKRDAVYTAKKGIYLVEAVIGLNNWRGLARKNPDNE